jgi:hypothetical protein
MSQITTIFNLLQPAQAQANDLDGQIKVYTAILKNFDGSQYRSKVDEQVSSEVIAEADTIVENLPKLTVDQKKEVLTELKNMVDTAESQLMQFMLSNLAKNPKASTLSELLSDIPEVEPEAEATEQTADPAQQLGELAKMMLSALKDVKLSDILGKLAK